VAIFILLSTLTDEGALTIKEDPARIKEVNQELDRMGLRVLSQWAVLGPYDFVNVVEAPDTLAVARRAVLARQRPHHDSAGDPDRRVHRRPGVKPALRWRLMADSHQLVARSA